MFEAVLLFCSFASSSELPGHLLDAAKIGSGHLWEQAGLRDGGFAKLGLCGAWWLLGVQPPMLQRFAGQCASGKNSGQ